MRLPPRWETRWCSAVAAFHSSRQSIDPSLLAFQICRSTSHQAVRPTPPDSHSPADVNRCFFFFPEVCSSTLLLLRTHLLAAGESLSGSGVISAAAIWTIYREPPTGHTCFYLFLNFCQALTCRLAPFSERLASFRLSHFGNFSGRPLHRKTQVCFQFFFLPPCK